MYGNTDFIQLPFHLTLSKCLNFYTLDTFKNALIFIHPGLGESYIRYAQCEVVQIKLLMKEGRKMF